MRSRPVEGSRSAGEVAGDHYSVRPVAVSCHAARFFYLTLNPVLQDVRADRGQSGAALRSVASKISSPGVGTGVVVWTVLA